jgi:hypothetical protein
MLATWREDAGPLAGNALRCEMSWRSRSPDRSASGVTSKVRSEQVRLLASDRMRSAPGRKGNRVRAASETEPHRPLRVRPFCPKARGTRIRSIAFSSPYTSTSAALLSLGTEHGSSLGPFKSREATRGAAPGSRNNTPVTTRSAPRRLLPLRARRERRARSLGGSQPPAARRARRAEVGIP